MRVRWGMSLTWRENGVKAETFTPLTMKRGETMKNRES